MTNPDLSSWLVENEGKAVWLEGCVRCGGSHMITAQPFTNPPTFGDKLIVTHFAYCPTSAEPILLYYQEKENDDAL